MEIAIKGLLGGLVAVAIHFAATSRHLYLAGLIPLFPIFALFAHAMFASSGRTADLQVSAQFGMLAMIPYGIYLLLAWWLADRMNIWFALLIAALSWGLAAAVIVLAWNKGGSLVTAIFNTRYALIVLISTLICSLISPGNRRNQRLVHIHDVATRPLKSARPRLVSASRVGYISVAIVSGYLLLVQPVQNGPTNPHDDVIANAGNAPAVQTSASTIETGAVTLPRDQAICDLLSEVLAAGPGNVAHRIQHKVLTRYVGLAKEALLAGDSYLATVYQQRASAMLFGSWVDSSTQKARYC